MELAADFAFQPLDNDEGTAAAGPRLAPGLGPLAGLAGTWSGQGFNAIWRPHRGASDHFLELNVTSDQIGLEVINGQIPNRGLVQAQIFMHGLTYLQQISDANVEVNGAPPGCISSRACGSTSRPPPTRKSPPLSPGWPPSRTARRSWSRGPPRPQPGDPRSRPSASPRSASASRNRRSTSTSST